MSRTPELLCAEVRDEPAKLARLEALFAAAKHRLPMASEDVSAYDRGAIGYLLHNFYSGCENIFRAIAAYFENDLSRYGWHADLLRRMRLTIPGIRFPVIDDALYRRLNNVRGFRHVVRNACGFEADWERDRLVAGGLNPAAPPLRPPVGPSVRD